MNGILIIKFYFRNNEFSFVNDFGCKYFWQLDEQLDDNLWGLIDKDTCVKDAIIIGSILIIGMLLNAAGMELKLKLNHMPLVLFFYGSMLLFFIQLIEIIKYKNTFKRIIKITFNIYIKIIECLILMLTLMDRLEYRISCSVIKYYSNEIIRIYIRE